MEDISYILGLSEEEFIQQQKALEAIYAKHKKPSMKLTLFTEEQHFKGQARFINGSSISILVKFIKSLDENILCNLAEFIVETS